MRRYLTGEEMLQDPHCMGCRIGWSQSVVFKAVGQSFVNKELVAHRRKVLLEREKSKIPDTQEFAIARRDLPILQQEYNNEREAFESRVRDLRTNWIRRNADKMNKIREFKNIVNTDGTHAKETRRSAFVHKCTFEGCEGFLSSSWKCGVCDNYTCKDCGKNRGNSTDQGHVCLEDDIASFSLIRSQCKPCPKCACQIYKIEGCDQMWCTMCQTPFSWRTGLEILGNVIHNPHFFEWQRNRSLTGEIPRQPQDLACGGRISVHDVSHASNAIFGLGWEGATGARAGPLIGSNEPNVFLSFMYWLLMLKNHIGEVDMPYLRPRAEVVDIEDKLLLSDFIVNKIDEKILCQKLGIKDKKRRFNAEYYDILETFTTVVEDMLRKICELAVREISRSSNGVHRARVETLEKVVELNELAQYLIKSVTALNKNYSYGQTRFKNELIELQNSIGYLFERMSQPRLWNQEWIPSSIKFPPREWTPPRGCEPWHRADYELHY